MLSPGIDALTWNPRDSMYPWMFSFILMRSPHIFLNLINQPRGRMVMEMYCGLLLFINSNLILLQLMLRISLTLQVSSLAQLLSFPVAFSDSGSLSQVRRSSQVSYPVEGFLSYESFSPKHRAYLMSVQSSHEPESFAEAFNHSCWRYAMQA